MPRPIEQFRKGRFRVSLWDGSYGITTQVQKGWKQADGNWVNKNVDIFDNELPILIDALTEAQTRIKAHKEAHETEERKKK